MGGSEVAKKKKKMVPAVSELVISYGRIARYIRIQGLRDDRD